MSGQGPWAPRTSKTNFSGSEKTPMGAAVSVAVAPVSAADVLDGLMPVAPPEPGV